MTKQSLQNLPEKILSTIIDFLPQNDKLNLLYTNYHFYVLVQPLLYKNLLFTKSTELKCEQSFDESLYTIIGVMKTPLATKKLNNKIYDARQQILLEALSVNIVLCKFVQNIRIEGDYHNDGNIDGLDETIYTPLYNFLLSNCPNLKSFSTFRLYENKTIVSTLEDVQLRDFNQFGSLFKSNVKNLYLDATDNLTDLDKYGNNELLQLFNRLETLVFNNETAQTLIINKLNSIFDTTKDKYFHFTNLKLIFYHCFDDPSEQILEFLNKINLNCLKRFEIVLGCDDMTCDCLTNFIKCLVRQDLNLNGLSLVQKTAHREHNYTEKFDYYVTELISSYPAKDRLKFLSIRHTPPDDFNVADGFEGNYLHRKSLYEVVLPKLNNLEILICPTFLQSIAGYEQLISNLLWNGCNCEHCNDYLPIFDKYILNHQYYDEVKSHMTDMISPILFGNVARVLSSRLSETNDMFLDVAVPLNRYWDFHTAPYQITHSKDCSIDKSAFPAIAVCVAHFLKTYVDSISDMIPTLKRCVLSGIFFDSNATDSGAKKWVCSDN